MSETRTHRGTTFKLVALRNDRHCSGCRSFLGWGLRAWRPTHGGGGYTRAATLCMECMTDVSRSAS